MVILVTACGGGGGSAGETAGVGGAVGEGSGGSTGQPTVSLTLTDTIGTSTNSLSPGSPLIAKALIKDSKGTAVKGALVTFSLSSGLAILSPSSGTALTDEQGIAQVGLEAGGEIGATEVSVKATVSGVEVSAKSAFSVGAPPSAVPAAINFVSALPQDKSIVLKGAGGNGRTEVALLSFTVVDSSNLGVANKKVNFALLTNEAASATNKVTLVSSSSTTNQSGQVTATVNSGSTPTTVRVVATVDGTSISALSDTVTVTTGQPVQMAFSLSAETYNISGWNHDNEQTKVNILMADQFGNPVADGTPVVFQTDSGAIGSSTNGGCITENGACSVTFRSQEPRYGPGNSQGKLPGIATITASSTSGGTTLTSQIFIALSSDYALPFYSGAELVADTSFASSNTQCQPFTVVIELHDVIGNAAPFGTTVGIEEATDITATVNPTSVGNSVGGTTHSLSLKPDATKCAAATAGSPVSATFTLVITTPKGMGPYKVPLKATYYGS
jgi:hypothetical protein